MDMQITCKGKSLNGPFPPSPLPQALKKRKDGIGALGNTPISLTNPLGVRNLARACSSSGWGSVWEGVHLKSTGFPLLKEA